MIALTLTLVLSAPRPLYHPSSETLKLAYAQADTIGRQWSRDATMLKLEPHWIDDGKSFWFYRDGYDGVGEFEKVDCATGVEAPLFDDSRLAAALSAQTGQTVDPHKLPFRTLELQANSVRFRVSMKRYEVDLSDYSIRAIGVPDGPGTRPAPWTQDLWPPSREAANSPDGAWTARIEGDNVKISPRGGQEKQLTSDGDPSGYYARLTWSADSKHLIAVKVHPGDRKKVYLIQNSPPGGGPAQLRERIYDRPGDKVDTFDVLVLDPTGSAAPFKAESIDYGDLPYFCPTKDGVFTYEKMDRGYGRWRIFRLDPTAGTCTAIVDDHPATFVDSTALVQKYLEKTDEIIVSSERDGWHHVYLADGKGGLKQITHGQWVVRGVDHIDEDHRQIYFTASGMNAGEDPYFIHYYRIDFDGQNLVALTPKLGNHVATFSPDGKTLVDTYSTVTTPPVHELRHADTGELVATLDHPDISRLLKSGWKPPQPFVAKGRDGKTDIYGVVFRPLNFDPSKRYPIVEDIYAGPQDSFVPKSFRPDFYQQRVADLGFVVVQIDGMGTRNRSKAFHDVCYKNLKDAGFADRILWMKALAATDPSIDLSRVGVYGTSAGGQNAAAAVLFHPEFYKVAVASCGCHDNRLDKIWWNEQWMGPIGPHYSACSNIDNAARLKGNLLLMVGELDTNVPPESTFRFAAALQSANKEFDLVVIPNSDHTAGGPYGERKRRDFLVRHLLGVDPPDPN